MLTVRSIKALLCIRSRLGCWLLQSAGCDLARNIRAKVVLLPRDSVHSGESEYCAYCLQPFQLGSHSNLPGYPDFQAVSRKRRKRTSHGKSTSLDHDLSSPRRVPAESDSG